MILGLSTLLFTQLHVIISLIGIGSGLLVVLGLMRGTAKSFITGLFLATTALTSLTGFAFPNTTITPGIVLGVLSLIVLAVAIAALYGFHLAGGWRRTYVISACVALYFNCFVLVAQLFRHVPFLTALDPAHGKLAFQVAQVVLLGIFVWLTVRAAKGFSKTIA